MKDALNKIIKSEIHSIQALLKELELQHQCIVKNDVFGMEECVSRIQEVNKEVAVLEVDRRKLTGKGSMKKIIEVVKEFSPAK